LRVVPLHLSMRGKRNSWNHTPLPDYR
jgi:hypothetical protein